MPYDADDAGTGRNLKVHVERNQNPGTVGFLRSMASDELGTEKMMSQIELGG